jgi:uncharacterized membrane protein
MTDPKPTEPPSANPAPSTRAPSQVVPQGFQLNTPTLVSILYLAAYLTGISAIIGLVIAYVKRGEAQAWEESHLTYLIRTFWLGILGWVVLILSMITIILIPLAWVGGVAITVWWIVRCIKSILAAQKEQPLPDPQTWMI